MTAEDVSRAKRLLSGFLLALLCLILFDEKIFATYLYPSLFLFWAAFVDDDHLKCFAKVKSNLLSLLLIASIVAFIAVLILTSRLHIGMTYYEIPKILIKHNLMPGYDYVGGLDPQSDKFFYYLLYWPYYARRFLDVELMDHLGTYRQPLGIFLVYISVSLLLFLLPLLTYICASLKLKRIITNYKTILLLSSSAIFAALCLTTPSIYAGHHFIYIWPPLLVLFSDFLTKQKGSLCTIAFGLFVLASLLTYFRLYQAEAYYETSSERSKIHDYFDNGFQGKAVVHHVVWGDYFLHMLHSSKDIFVSYGIFDMRFEGSAKARASLNAPVYLVCRKPDPRYSQEMYQYAECSEQGMLPIARHISGPQAGVENILPDLKIWGLYKVKTP